MVLSATTDEVRRKILEIPAFQTEGKFDSKHYEGLLRQMHMTPDVFEQEMSEDITTHESQGFHKGTRGCYRR